MKKLCLSILTILILLPIPALAATILSGQEVYVDQHISDDVYTAGGILSVTKTINGDLVAAGGRVTIEGNISQDLMAGAGDLSVRGEIGDDVRVAGGSVRIEATIKDDLIGAAGNFTLTDNSFVGGDVLLAGGSMIIGGIVNGDMKLTGGSLYLNSNVKGDLSLINFDSVTFGPDASVEGGLTYRAVQPLEIPGGVVKGQVTYTPVKTSQVKDNLPAILAGFSLFSLLATLFFGLFFLWLCRYYILHAVAIAHESALKSVGVGFLVLIITPIVFLIFLLTTIGVPLAFVLLALWLVFLYTGKVMAAMLIGFKLVRVDETSPFTRLFASFALGALIYALIAMVPVVGWLVNLILILIALGSMTLYEFELFGQMRKKKIV